MSQSLLAEELFKEASKFYKKADLDNAGLLQYNLSFLLFDLAASFSWPRRKTYRSLETRSNARQGADFEVRTYMNRVLLCGCSFLLLRECVSTIVHRSFS